MIEPVKFRVGRRLVSGKIEYKNNRAYLYFPFNKKLLAEVKSFAGRKYHGYDPEPKKIWSIPLTKRNTFQLDYLLGGNPYATYDKSLIEHEIIYPEYTHQTDLVNQALTTHYCIWAAEMGTGKTLAALITMIESGAKDWWWFGPKSALYSVKLDIIKWQRWAEEHNIPKDKFPILPKMYTYHAVTKIMKNWQDGDISPQGVVFDESSRLKTYTAQRTQASQALTDGIRNDWGDEGFVIEMTGTPAPKAPVDWWSQCEIACPGFIKEGDIHKFKNRLGIVEQRENTITQGTYPHLVAWRDNTEICTVCGQKEIDHIMEYEDGSPNPFYHPFKACVNEVEKLYRRMQGLVLVKFKKDCIDLPDKIYKVIDCKPSKQLLQYAKTILRTSPRVVTGLMRLRELSDGFLYQEEKDGEKNCSVCHGKGQAKQEVLKEGYELLEDGNILELQTQQEYTIMESDEFWETAEDAICSSCGGSGKVPTYKRIIQETISPKEKVLKDLLDEYEEVGRVVIYAGFEGSLNKVEKVCLEKEWTILRADGKGWKASSGTVEEILQAMDNSHQDKKMFEEKYPKIAFIGQPGAAGMGLNLTASPVIIYYSNDFNGENRIQSEDRVHRAGMDANRAPTIIDIVNLESDRRILENLKKKRVLQNMSMGIFKNILNDGSGRIAYEDSVSS